MYEIILTLSIICGNANSYLKLAYCEQCKSLGGELISHLKNVGTNHGIIKEKGKKTLCFNSNSSDLSQTGSYFHNLKMADAQNPSFQQQKVIIRNKHGNRLVGILHESGTQEIAILCHGLRASKENFIMTNLAAALENAGISSFRFDFTGNGESEGSFEFGSYWREAEDIRAVAQHFQETNRTVIAIVGHSKGANAALLYASKYHDTKTIVNLSGSHDLKVGLENRFGKDFMERLTKEGFIELKAESAGGIDYRVTEESLKDRLNIIMIEECLHIDKECRVFTVHGGTDTIIPVVAALEFAKVLPNHKLHIIEGADHVYTDHQTELASFVVDVIKETLQMDLLNAS
ncbi:hypothetical protein VNO80_22358 [Phaseolus coccineus]|uniref:Serine aminopeptidase S33 domain-containing protein n=1 Tax=Phaseolus coccineus TaxID=3886 RepID=A0AAN9M4Y5_PHACN